MTLDEIRAELPVVRRVAYLNAGTFGPLPRRTAEAMSAQARRELADGRAGLAYWERLRGLRAQVREGIARLIGADPAQLALTRSTTDGCNVAVAGLGLRPQDEVVTTDCEHFGLLGALAASGARVRVAPIRDRPAGEALEAVAGLIGARTRLVAVSHVVWTTGQVMPVRALADTGVPLLVDGAQGAGAVPVDVEELGCDFYTVSGQKWLLGPDGTGALYVSPRLLERQRVAFPSYYSQQAFEPDGAFVPAEGAPRFDVGTVPAPALAGLLAAIGLHQELGPERFAAARRTAERFRAELAQHADVVTEPGQATLVSFRPRGDAAETVARLAERGVVVRDLPGLGWVRASVGFWTSEDDLERLLDGLRS